MIPAKHIPTLEATARAMLPGMLQARSQLDASIRVLHYLAYHAASNVKNETATTFTLPDPQLFADVAQVRAMLRAFTRLHEKRN